MRQHTRTLALPLLAGLACGSANESGADKTPADSGTQSTSEVELYSWWSSTGETLALASVYEIFARNHPDVTIRNAANEGNSEDAKTELRERVAANDPPDLFQTLPRDIGNWAAFDTGDGTTANKLLALDVLLDSTGARSHIPQALLDMVSFSDAGGSHVVAIPINLHRHNGMFYNKNVFASLGVEPPSSLTEFVSVCDAILLRNEGLPAEQHIAPIALSRQGWILEILFNSVVAGSASPQFLSSYKSGEQQPSAPEMTAAVRAMNDVLRCAYQPADDSFGWDDAARLLKDERAAMFVHGDWAKGLLEQEGLLPGTDFDVLPAFGTDGMFLYNVDAFAMFDGAPNHETAQNLLATFVSIEGQAAFNRIKGSSPARDDVELGSFDSVAVKTIEDMRNATLLESVEKVPSAWGDAVGAALAEFWLARQAVQFDPSDGLDADADTVMGVFSVNYPLLQPKD